MEHLIEFCINTYIVNHIWSFSLPCDIWLWVALKHQIKVIVFIGLSIIDNVFIRQRSCQAERHLVDGMTCFGRHDALFDVMTCFGRHDALFDFMTCFGRHDALFDVMTHFLTSWRDLDVINFLTSWRVLDVMTHFVDLMNEQYSLREGK